MSSRTNLRLASFDHGGVRSLSQLEIMSNIMHRLNWGRDPNESQLPCQHFDLIGGSGTGGLIVIMLAKLRMSAEDAAEEFSTIIENVFAPVDITTSERTKRLRSSLEIMITRRGLPVDLKLEEEVSTGSCACFVVANPLANLATKFCLRSYSARGRRADPITVIDAALATCVVRSLFDPVTVGVGNKRKEYAGVGRGANNPIREVISEARSLFGGTSTVESLLSVGTGHHGIMIFKSDGSDAELDKEMEDVMADCTHKAKEVEDQIGRAGIYFRFSVEHGLQTDRRSEVMDATWIITQTESYLDEQEDKLEEFTQSVGTPASVVTVDQLKSGDVSAAPDRISMHLGAAQLEAAAKAYDEVLLAKLKPPDVERGSPIGECMEGTREDLLEKVLNWVADIAAPNIFWLTGHPGVGKSAIAASLVEKLRASEHLGSGFFFQREKANSMTPNALWRSIAYDLARRNPTMKKYLMAVLEADETLPTTPSVEILFRELIQNPIAASEETDGENGIVVVIDALDECGGLDGQYSSHRVNLMRTLKNWSTLPNKFKLVVTSRAEPDIVDLFSNIQHGSFEILSGDSVSPRSSEDIERFLEYHLDQIVARSHGALALDWPGHQNIKLLARIAAGLFVWVETAIRFLKRGEPQEQLNRILDGAKMGGLFTLYSSILGASFVEPSEKVLEGFRRIVGAIILAKDPLTASSLAHLCSVDHSTMTYIRSGLQSVIDPGDLLRFNHQSFVDFLINSRQSQSAFYIDLRKQKREITLACLKAMKMHLCFNICDIKTSYKLNEDIVNLDLRVKEYIPHHVSYSCYYWAQHLTEAKMDAEILEYVVYFMETLFLFWLEVLSLTKRVNTATRMMSLLVDWLKAGKQSHRMALDMKKFVAAFGSVILQSMPHIYLSALSFSPQNSAVYTQYTQYYPQKIGIEQGGYDKWPPIQNLIPCVTECVAFSPDGTRIVSSFQAQAIRVWDAETAKMIAGPFEGHTRVVMSVAFSPDGTRIVSGSADTTIRVWDAETAELVTGPFEGHTDVVKSVAFSPDGLCIVSGSADMTIRVWDAKTMEALAGPFEGHTASVNSVAFSPDGLRIVSGSDDKTIRLWDAETAAPIAGPFEGHTSWVGSIAFSPDGKRIVSGSEDSTIRVWDVETAEVVTGTVESYLNWVKSVAFSPDGARVVSGSDDGIIRLWDAETAELISEPFEGHNETITCVAFSPDGTRIVSSSYDATIRLWDAEIVDEVVEVVEADIGSTGVLPEGDHNSVYFADDTISDSSTESTEGFNVPFDHHIQEAVCVSISPDGRRIASGSLDGVVWVWNAETAEVFAGPFEGDEAPVSCVAFSPDGTRIVSGAYWDAFCVWDAETTDVILGPFEGHTGSVRSVVFSTDGLYIASGSSDQTIRVWDAETAALMAGPFEGHTGGVTSIAFSSDGTRIVSGSSDQTIRVWDTGTAEMVAGPFEGHTDVVTSVVFSPGGTRIVSGSEDNSIRMWDTQFATIAPGPFEGHTESVTSVKFSPDGRRIISGSDDSTIRIWDSETAETVVGPLEGHNGAINCVDISSDGARIVSSSSDKTIRVWGITTPSLQTPSSTLLSFGDSSRLVDGWIVGPDSELLFWVPPAIRMGLSRPRTISIIGERLLITKLNLDHFVHGESWTRCMNPLPHQSIHAESYMAHVTPRVGHAKRKLPLDGREEDPDVEASTSKRARVEE